MNKKKSFIIERKYHDKLKTTHGGKRINAGRKELYGEPVKRIMISIPASKELEIREKIKSILKKYLPA